MQYSGIVLFPKHLKYSFYCFAKVFILLQCSWNTPLVYKRTIKHSLVISIKFWGIFNSTKKLVFDSSANIEKKI